MQRSSSSADSGHSLWWGYCETHRATDERPLQALCVYGMPAGRDAAECLVAGFKPIQPGPRLVLPDGGKTGSVATSRAVARAAAVEQAQQERDTANKMRREAIDVRMRSEAIHTEVYAAQAQYDATVSALSMLEEDMDMSAEEKRDERKRLRGEISTLLDELKALRQAAKELSLSQQHRLPVAPAKLERSAASASVYPAATSVQGGPKPATTPPKIPHLSAPAASPVASSVLSGAAAEAAVTHPVSTGPLSGGNASSGAAAAAAATDAAATAAAAAADNDTDLAARGKEEVSEPDDDAGAAAVVPVAAAPVVPAATAKRRGEQQRRAAKRPARFE
jgi:hypothetical protein